MQDDKMEKIEGLTNEENDKMEKLEGLTNEENLVDCKKE